MIDLQVLTLKRPYLKLGCVHHFWMVCSVKRFIFETVQGKKCWMKLQSDWRKTSQQAHSDWAIDWIPDWQKNYHGSLSLYPSFARRFLISAWKLEIWRLEHAAGGCETHELLFLFFVQWESSSSLFDPFRWASTTLRQVCFGRRHHFQNASNMKAMHSLCNKCYEHFESNELRKPSKAKHAGGVKKGSRSYMKLWWNCDTEVGSLLFPPPNSMDH